MSSRSLSPSTSPLLLALQTVEDQSYQSYQFFTGTAEDIELPEVRKRVRREEGGGEGGEGGGEEGGGEGGEGGGEEGGGAGEEEEERDEPIIGDYDERDISLQQHQVGVHAGLNPPLVISKSTYIFNFCFLHLLSPYDCWYIL